MQLNIYAYSFIEFIFLKFPFFFRILTWKRRIINISAMILVYNGLENRKPQNVNVRGRIRCNLILLAGRAICDR